MKKGRLFYFLSMVLFWIIFSESSFAAGLLTRFAEVVMEDLKIGQSYNITEITQRALVVENTGEGTITIKIEPEKPIENEIKQGYEPIPDPSWVKVAQTIFIVGPKGKATTELMISIPDDETHLGKKYQVMIWSRGISGAIAGGVRSTILLNISEDRPTLGLSVQPGIYLFKDISVGKRYKLPLPLKIKNKSDVARTYLLSVYKPTEKGEKVAEGYLEIPEPSWFWFEKDEVTVEANSKADVKMYLKIPDEKRYYNQHWVVSLGVAGKPAPGSTIALAIYPRIQIETEAKDDVKARPDGSIGFVPSTLLFENLSLSTENTMKVKVYNNDTKRHRYTITPMVFPQDPKKRQIFPSPRYSWIPNPNWIKQRRKNISIACNKARVLPITVKIPQGLENHNKKWEAIIFVEPDEGLPGFVRVQIKTEKLKK